MTSRPALFAGFVVLIVGSLLGPPRAAAQPAAAALRVGLTDRGAWVYHPLQAPPGGAVWLERQETDGTFTPLTPEPLAPVLRGDAFAARLGTIYEAVRQDADRATPTDVLLRLRRDPIAARLLTFAYPEVADALGRRAFDSTATPGTTRTYRARMVDAEGRDMSMPLVTTVTLARPALAPVTALTGHLDRGALVLSWTYARADAVRDDGVIGFRAACGDSLQTPRPVLRTTTETAYHARFSAHGDGQTLACRILPVLFWGEDGPAATLLITLPDATPPGRVARVDAVAQGDSLVQLTWPLRDEPDVAGYHVYHSRTATEGFRRITTAPVTAASFAHRAEGGAAPHFYRVTAVDHAGNESAVSGPAYVVVRDRRGPPKPERLTATRTPTGHTRLAWAPVAAPDLLGYVVLRRNRTARSGPAYAQASGQELLHTPTFEDTGEAGTAFEEGASYEYAVLAADSARNLSDTAFVTVRVPDRTPPPAPTGLIATSDGGRLTLAWAPPPAADLGGYRLYRAEDAAPLRPWRTLGRYEGSTRDDSVALGHAYTYSVAAVDTSGNEGPRAAPVRVTARDDEAPAGVRNVRAEASADGVMVTWEPSRAPDLAGYRVLRADTPTGVFAPVSPLVSETGWRDPAGTAAHWYRVVAVDTSGNKGRPGPPARVGGRAQ